MQVRILGSVTQSQIPVLLKRLGQASCGFPSPGLDFEEPPLSLDDLVKLREPSTFVGRAFGTSMTGIGIFNDDWLVIDKSLEPVQGDVIVAIANGDFTVKTFRRDPNGNIQLVAENPAHKPLTFGNAEEVDLFGVVTYCIHQFRSAHRLR
ncbi:LexA family protein [Pseudomonas luteola]